MPSIHSSVITRREVRLQSISRHEEAGLGDQILAQLGGGGGLLAKVQLAVRPLPEGGDDQPGPQPGRLAAHRLDLGGRPFVGLDGVGEILLDVRGGAP